MVSQTQQKVAVSFMGAITCAVIFLGVYQFQHHLAGPGKKTAKVIPTEQVSEAFLNTKDTDGDGLTDFEEQSSYATSPYITDSDSDGASDYEEVRAGTDPACPQGKNCFKGDFGYTLDLTPATVSNGIQVGAREIQPGSLQAPTAGELSLASGGKVDAATVRQLLIKAGGKPEIIGKLTDAQILKLYDDTLKDSPDLREQQKIFAQAPSGKEMQAIRDQMIAAGMPKVQVDTLTDAQIYAALTQSLTAKKTP